MSKSRNRNSTEYYEGTICKKCNTSTRQVHDNRCFFCLKQRQDRYNNKLRENSFMQVHGVTFSEREKMFQKQKGLCLICKTKGHIDLLNKGAPTKGRLVVDHCHKTGKVRGLICNACNIGLGVFKDNCEVLWNAIMYLEDNG